MNKRRVRINKYFAYCLVGIAILLCGLFLFTSKSKRIKSQEIRALENAASAIQIKTGSVVYRQSQDRVLYTEGYPKSPEVVIRYEPRNNNTKEDLYQEIIKSLENNNWQMEQLFADQPGYYRAILPLPQTYFSLTAEVLIHPERNIVSVHLGTNPS